MASDIESFKGFLQACDVNPGPFSGANAGLRRQAEEARLKNMPDYLRGNAPIGLAPAQDNPNISVGMRGNLAVVSVGGRDAQIHVYFENGKAAQVDIGNAGLSGTSAYEADPKILGKLASAAPRAVLPKGIVLAKLAKSLDAHSPYDFNHRDAKLDTQSNEGRLGVLAFVHRKLSEAHLAVPDFRQRRPQAGPARPAPAHSR